MKPTFDPRRLRLANDAPVRADRGYVLYWCIATRRTHANFALDRAIGWAKELGTGLVVLEALRVDPPWASRRVHTFVIEGMADNRARYASSPITYHAYVEPAVDAGRGLLQSLAGGAAVVVTDEWPCLFHPAMVTAAGARIDVRLEVVDGNGLVPLAAADKDYRRAFDFRRALPKLLAHDEPCADPLAGLTLPRVTVPADVQQRWPDAPVDLSRLPILPLPPAPVTGGHAAAAAVLNAFVGRLARYDEGRRHPDEQATSGLSPWLHFGALGTHEILAAVRAAASGDTEPFGVSAEGATFLDELVTWRELAYHTAARNPLAFSYDGLPSWARESLAREVATPREVIYDFATLDEANTHDPIWNAAQRQLRSEGRIHNYLRMLWGKRVLAWSEDPREAYETLVELNNRYAIDGRDPCSYAGIAWCFGRYDRPWPRQPVFGVVRMMSSASTRKKVHLRDYLERWA